MIENTDWPLICWDNQLSLVSSYSVTLGQDGSSAPLNNAWTWDALRLAIPRADAGGQWQVELDITPQQMLDSTSFGAWYFGGFGVPDVLVLGAHQHDEAGFRFAEGQVQLEYWNGAAWVELIEQQDIIAAPHQSMICKMAYHEPELVGSAYRYRLTFYGLDASGDFVVPELFLGPALEMPPLDLGYDPENEIWTGSKFRASSGRLVRRTSARQMMGRASWDGDARITADKMIEINMFREAQLEEALPFWWFWMPDSAPFHGYLMLNPAEEVPAPIRSGNYRTWQLPMEESV
ncbi:MAG: hypothetical protein COS35_06475 [Zetaproteobacteria bacterium CG02_land_8_20_14_3_00_50_9]|nr:MAG: hypothetical protein AUJ57_07790 [Zetaproteobacteria bacterium CG1_02_53_45]PIV30485.1 MAG: hypothetical protein COS35_06475 [Zetaproteobacteria bacterium CG02_land_8_20_14_3_00_50_9]